MKVLTLSLKMEGKHKTRQSLGLGCSTTLITNPGTTPITILAVNSDHGLSFAGEETRTMLSEFPFLYKLQYFSILAVQTLRGLSFLILWGMGVVLVARAIRNAIRANRFARIIRS